MDSLHGKIAIVTGGTRGIGRAIAERLVAEGAKVALCGRTRDAAERAAREIGGEGSVLGVAADIRKVEDVRALFDAVDRAFGGLDILVNNAGEGVFRKVGEMTVEDWHRNIDLNLNGVFYCTREAIGRMRARGGGFIVNISSLAARNPFAGGAGYSASKFALNGFTEALMLDHRYDGIRVTSIMPGSVATDFGGSGKPPTADDWKVAPEDVAETVAMVLKMPARTMVSRVEMRPSQPRK
ncbi:MAG: SDR family oxidoreductase [Acidobacteriota bacterium]|nr:SDR family oxidoreductase [Acidobacteriota bacterium]